MPRVDSSRGSRDAVREKMLPSSTVGQETEAMTTMRSAYLQFIAAGLQPVDPPRHSPVALDGPCPLKGEGRLRQQPLSMG
jgi:hypothetical protein